MSRYKKVDDRRLKRVIMTDEVVNQIFRGDVGIVCGLPDDVQFVRAFEVPERMTKEYVFKSKEFDKVEEGAKIPHTQVGVIHLDADVRKELHYDWSNI